MDDWLEGVVHSLLWESFTLINQVVENTCIFMTLWVQGATLWAKL